MKKRNQKLKKKEKIPIISMMKTGENELLLRKNNNYLSICNIV